MRLHTLAGPRAFELFASNATSARQRCPWHICINCVSAPAISAMASSGPRPGRSRLSSASGALQRHPGLRLPGAALKLLDLPPQQHWMNAHFLRDLLLAHPSPLREPTAPHVRSALCSFLRSDTANTIILHLSGASGISGRPKFLARSQRTASDAGRLPGKRFRDGIAVRTKIGPTRKTARIFSHAS